VSCQPPRIAWRNASKVTSHVSSVFHSGWSAAWQLVVGVVMVGRRITNVRARPLTTRHCAGTRLGRALDGDPSRREDARRESDGPVSFRARGYRGGVTAGSARLRVRGGRPAAVPRPVGFRP
jgi:hypothetical protein